MDRLDQVGLSDSRRVRHLLHLHLSRRSSDAIARSRGCCAAASVDDQTLQAIAWRDPEVLDILRRMDQLELPQGRPLHRPVDALDALLMPDALGVLAAERSDHDTSA